MHIHPIPPRPAAAPHCGRERCLDHKRRVTNLFHVAWAPMPQSCPRIPKMALENSWMGLGPIKWIGFLQQSTCWPSFTPGEGTGRSLDLTAACLLLLPTGIIPELLYWLVDYYCWKKGMLESARERARNFLHACWRCSRCVDQSNSIVK